MRNCFVPFDDGYRENPTWDSMNRWNENVVHCILGDDDHIILDECTVVVAQISFTLSSDSNSFHWQLDCSWIFFQHPACLIKYLSRSFKYELRESRRLSHQRTTILPSDGWWNERPLQVVMICNYIKISTCTTYHVFQKTPLLTSSM